VVLWFTYLLCECLYVLHTEGPASCVKLYVALCSGEFHSQLLLFPTQTSIVLPPQSHCHHALCALSLSLIPVVTLVNFGSPVEVLPC
jgi:hypothetical protein